MGTPGDGLCRHRSEGLLCVFLRTDFQGWIALILTPDQNGMQPNAPDPPRRALS